jgi:hypothetical protein
MTKGSFPVITAILNISALRAETSLGTDQPIYVQGYHTPGDGGEGMFLCDPGTTIADNGGTIIADKHGNCWRRQTEGHPYSVKWFGAKGDGTTDDRDAIQAAITTVERLPFGGTVWLPAGKYRITAPLRITASLTLLGAGNQTIDGATRIAPTFMDLNAIEVSNMYGFVIRGIDIDPGSPPSGFGGAAIHLYQCQRVEIEDVNIYHLWNGILNDSSGDVYMRRVTIRPADVPFVGSGYRFGVKCTAQNSKTPPGGNPNLTMCDTVIVNDQGDHQRTVHGFIHANNYGSLTLLNCGTLNCDISRWITSDGGSPPDFFVETCGTSDSCGSGWSIEEGLPGGNILLDNCLCTGSTNENYYVRSTFVGDVQLNGCRAVQTGSPDTAGHGAGFSLNGPGNYTLSGCTAWHTGGHNVAISGGAKVSISGGVFSLAGANNANSDKDGFHVYSNANGSLTVSGVNQHDASRGMFDDGSSCVIYGHGLFLGNSVTGVDIRQNHSSPPSSVLHP